ncbi:haloacid dehalogenase, type II [Viridothelium virens]|uniref:Haloacid dehalogenase, type II n=1 Tax=Viridothelium virens TaxID=1048519 RepID=A0A6A6H7Q0_VIRVR|nr:haloacid dehalogenase, type II [Viridothelium virens]
MSSSRDIVVAFDLYGTLLSTDSIAKKLSEHFGQDKATIIATAWRKYQLEYTWRLNSMNQFEPFSKITHRSLKNALSESRVSLEEEDQNELMKAYDSLSTFPDVKPALTALASVPGITAAVFSNGTQSMVSNSVNHSPDLAPHANTFQQIIVVEECKKFKPAPEVYEMLAQKMGKSKEKMTEMWLVSGNPFDIVGAKSAGMQAAWVDRAGNGWQDELLGGDEGRPTAIVKSLGEVVDAVKKHADRLQHS